MSSSKGIAAWLKPKRRQTLTIKEKEERDLQRAIELSQQTQREENEQRARFELLAARTLEMSKRPYHRHDKDMPFVNGEEDDRFETLTNRIVKKEKIGPSSRCQRRQEEKQQREKGENKNEKGKENDKQKGKGKEGNMVECLKQDHQIKEEKEEEEEEIIFDVDEIDQWLAEDDNENIDGYNSHTDPLASSPPSPYLHQFDNDDEQQLSSALPSSSGSHHERKERHEQPDNDDNQEEETALCPLCRRKVSRLLLYQHTLGCPGDFSNDNTAIDSHNDSYDNHNGQHEEQYTTNVDSSPSTQELSLIPRRSSVIHESMKRKSSKSMAAGVIQEQKRQKSLNMSSSRRPYNHYSLHDAELEEQFDTAGFGGNVSGLSWETRGQSRYR